MEAGAALPNKEIPRSPLTTSIDRPLQYMWRLSRLKTVILLETMSLWERQTGWGAWGEGERGAVLTGRFEAHTMLKFIYTKQSLFYACVSHVGCCSPSLYSAVSPEPLRTTRPPSATNLSTHRAIREGDTRPSLASRCM